MNKSVYLIVVDLDCAKQTSSVQENPTSGPVSSTTKRTLAERKPYEEDDRESCLSSKKGIYMGFPLYLCVYWGSRDVIRIFPYILDGFPPNNPIYRK